MRFSSGGVRKDIDRNPLIINTPDWQKEVEGKWVTATSARVYCYESVNATSLPLPLEFKTNAHYHLGFDIGFNPDPSAFIISAHNTKYDDKWRIIKSFKRTNMLTADIANESRSWMLYTTLILLWQTQGH